MIAYWWYLLKVSIGMISFYGIYALAFRKNTFHGLNRFYLLSGLLLSFMIPLLKISVFESRYDLIPELLSASWIEPVMNLPRSQVDSDASGAIGFLNILSVLYFSGIVLLCTRLFFSITATLRTKQTAITSRYGRLRIVKTKSPVPFSFFNIVFLPEGESDPMIIRHELMHVRQYHWIDLVLLEIASMILWINPFVILYKRSLKMQHEYLADSGIIRRTWNAERYLHCMLKQIRIVSANGLSSHFYCKTIKKRITMLTKNKTSVKYTGIYLLVLPITALLIYSFSGSGKRTESGPVIVSNGNDQPSVYPVDRSKVTSIAEYGDWIHPISKQKAFHQGMDFAVPEGEMILSTASGVVTEADYDSLRGNYVFIQHSKVFTTFYSHLKNVIVSKGQTVAKEQTIGMSGNTGLSTGSHLHYEVIKDEKRVDPREYLPR